MKRRGLVVALGLGLGLALAMLQVAGGERSLALAAPRALASGSDWDGLTVSTPTVIKVPGKYLMWYQGRSLTFTGYGFALGCADSMDGLGWSKHASNPVLEPGEAGAWDGAYRGQVAVLADGGIYKMWYSGGPSSGSWQTGYATSADGLAWQIYAGNPVLAAGASGSWDETESDGPTVIKDGVLYKMWYHGCNADYTVCSIGYATSPDGVAWTKFAGNPVLASPPGSWDASGLAWPRVIKNGSTYEMWYHSDGKIGRATSPDGATWTKYAGNPVLSAGWDGAGVGVAAVLLDGGTYKMWVSSGAGATRGIGYAESTDGIHWTQPVPNPILLPGEAGVIARVAYDSDDVLARTLGNTAVTIAVSDGGGIKASISGVTDAGGAYRSWEHNEDWTPGEPDIVPGDSVSATAGAFSTIIDTVGEIDAHARADTDRVAGTIHAPWLAPSSLSVLCEVWTDPSQVYLDTDVPADGGSFACDFSGLADLVGGVDGVGGVAGYLEPDGDMVAVSFSTPYMEVYYGTLEGVGGIYSPGHTFGITVTNSLGVPKATATVTSTTEGGWWGHGFRPTSAGGECCSWSPATPDIQPGDWVTYRSDDGYVNQVRAGSIFGTVNVENDSVTGPIFAPGLTQTLTVWCHPNGMGPPLYRQSSAAPDGTVPYSCGWQNPTGGEEPWDIQPADMVMVQYAEPDGDQVYRMMVASEGAPPNYIRLPLVMRNR